jgi:hypothetical protein
LIQEKPVAKRKNNIRYSAFSFVSVFKAKELNKNNKLKTLYKKKEFVKETRGDNVFKTE